MNERVLNNPIPPRAVNSQISPELQEIIYRALEREPANRYKTADEFIWDLEHPEQVGVAEREELTNWKQRRDPWARHVGVLRRHGADPDGGSGAAVSGRAALTEALGAH